VIVNVDSVFADGWQDTITIITNVAMGKAILNAFSDEIIYVSGGVRVTPPEEQSEAIESGIGDVTTSLI